MRQYNEEYFVVVEDNLKQSGQRWERCYKHLRQIQCNIQSTETRMKAGMPTQEEDARRHRSARREECVMQEAVKRWEQGIFTVLADRICPGGEMAYWLFASEMHDLFIPFAMERDRLRAQPNKERGHMVTPQDLCLMLTPQDVMRQMVTPGDLLGLKRVRFAI